MADRTTEIDFKIIEAIYDTVHKGNNWDTVIDLFCQAFNSTAAGFFEVLTEQTQQSITPIFVFKGIEDDMLQQYNDYYASVNPIFTTEGYAGKRVFMSDDGLEKFTGNKGIWKHSEYQSGWLRHLDMLHTIGGSLENREGDLLNFTLLRAQCNDYYSSEEKQRFAILFSHLKRGIELKRKLNLLDLNNQINESALGTLGVGIITLDYLGRIVFLNQLADQLANKKSIYFIRNQKPVFFDSSNQARFITSLNEAISKRSTQFFSLRGKFGGRYTITVSGLSEKRTDFTSTTHGATVFISTEDRDQKLSPNMLIERWGLTQSEAKLAALLVNGLEIRKAAERLHISYETARYYSKRIYQKAEVNSQAALIVKGLRDYGSILGSSLVL